MFNIHGNVDLFMNCWYHKEPKTFKKELNSDDNYSNYSNHSILITHKLFLY